MSMQGAKREEVGATKTVTEEDREGAKKGREQHKSERVRAASSRAWNGEAATSRRQTKEQKDRFNYTTNAIPQQED